MTETTETTETTEKEDDMCASGGSAGTLHATVFIVNNTEKEELEEIKQ